MHPTGTSGDQLADEAPPARDVTPRSRRRSPRWSGTATPSARGDDKTASRRVRSALRDPANTPHPNSCPDRVPGTRAPRAANQAAHWWHPVDQRDQLGDVVAVAAGERPGERDPGCVDKRWCLEPFLALSTGLGPVAEPPLAECGWGCRLGGARLVEVGAVVAARGSSLSLVRGLGAGDMMVDGDSRGRAVSGRPVFCGQRRAGARARHGAFGSRPEALSDASMSDGRWRSLFRSTAAPVRAAASPTATSAW